MCVHDVAGHVGEGWSRHTDAGHGGRCCGNCSRLCVLLLQPGNMAAEANTSVELLMNLKKKTVASSSQG